MGLTDDENRRLEELGDRLNFDDPAWANQLTGAGMAAAAQVRRRRTLACVVGLVISVILTPVSVFFGATVLSGIGMVMLSLSLIGLALQ